MAKTDFKHVDTSLNAPAEEAYRVLRSNIQFCGFLNRIKSIVITSCGPGEGKTTTAFNLAVSMAKSGMKVLLVDADLRKPSVAKLFGRDDSPGLSNLIAGCLPVQDAIKHTELERLQYISGGPRPPNPTELIGSDRFYDFMETVEKDYDIVIYDTPPLGNVIDCALIAARADGTIIVIEPNVNEYGSVQKIKDQLEKANAKILGVVLNKIRKHEYGNYYRYYKHYDSSSERNRKRSVLKKIFGDNERVPS